VSIQILPSPGKEKMAGHPNTLVRPGETHTYSAAHNRFVGSFLMVQRGQREDFGGKGAGLDRFLGAGLAISGLLLVFGWLLPVMTVETLYIFEDRISIIGALLTLVEEGEILLFAIIFLFTVAFPLAKLGLAYLAWHELPRQGSRAERRIGWIENLGKWSMLDVFAAALLIVVLKLSAVSEVSVEIGLYVFIAAVVASMLLVRRIARLSRRGREFEASGTPV
jgi:paraquat-inducible protein A